jgi:hypothetical protein
LKSWSNLTSEIEDEYLEDYSPGEDDPEYEPEDDEESEDDFDDGTPAPEEPDLDLGGTHTAIEGDFESVRT